MSNDDRTVWCGNLSEEVTEELLYELFIQAGPLEKVVIPKSKEGRQRNFAFITFKHEESVPYTIQLLQSIQLYGRPLRLQHRSGSVHDKTHQQQQQQQQQIRQSPVSENWSQNGQSPRHPSPMRDDNHSPKELHRSNTWPRNMDVGEQRQRADVSSRDRNAGTNYIEFSRNDQFVMSHQPMSRPSQEERLWRLQQAQAMQLQAASRMQQSYPRQYNDYRQQQAFRGRRW